MLNFCLNCEKCDIYEHSFIKDASAEQLELIFETKSCYKYKKGQNIFFEGARPLGLFCISKGKAKIYKTGVNGKEQITHFGKPGDFIGYRALVTGEKYIVSATAIEESIACFIPQDVFFKVLDNNPKFCRELLYNTCHEMGVAIERIQSMAQKSVRERLAESLLLLLDTFNQNNQNNQKETLINVTLSRESIANTVGTSTETLIRLLSEFKRDGLVKFEGKKIRLLDIDQLEKISMSL